MPFRGVEICERGLSVENAHARIPHFPVPLVRNVNASVDQRRGGLWNRENEVSTMKANSSRSDAVHVVFGRGALVQVVERGGHRSTVSYP